HAIEKGNVAMIEALVNQHGADVNVQDNNGETPIALAQKLKEFNEEVDIVKILSNRSESIFKNPSLLFSNMFGWAAKQPPKSHSPKK
ncbi:ankyrin repeat domain-containing protein, partial [bacterium]|nr:ankyrin repeat domain-containing protein [bacterium]